MKHRMSPARVEAFFRALEETGNQTIAAERARVSRTWAIWCRKRDPAFAARMAATIAAARTRLRAADALQPAAKWRMLAGEELTLRGRRGEMVQIQRARLNQWTPRREARFLAALASCCNVSAACRAVGVSVAGAYKHYARWPDFEMRWRAALEEGSLRLEMALFDAAGRVFRPVDYPQDVPIEPMTFDQAITLLKAHEARVHRLARPRKRWEKAERTADEAFASIAAKLDRMERAQARRAAVDPAVDARAVAEGMRIVRER